MSSEHEDLLREDLSAGQTGQSLSALAGCSSLRLLACYGGVTPRTELIALAPIECMMCYNLDGGRCCAEDVEDEVKMSKFPIPLLRTSFSHTVDCPRNAASRRPRSFGAAPVSNLDRVFWVLLAVHLSSR